MRALTRLGILTVATTYSLIETAHFGWNWWPKTDAELICDGISLVLMAVAFVMPVKER